MLEGSYQQTINLAIFYTVGKTCCGKHANAVLHYEAQGFVSLGGTVSQQTGDHFKVLFNLFLSTLMYLVGQNQ